MYIADMPVRHVAVGDQYMFTHNDDCIALGEYNDGGFYLMEDDAVDLFPTAMVAFSYLNTKYRMRRSSQLKQSIENS